MDLSYFHQADEAGQVITEEGTPLWRPRCQPTRREDVERQLMAVKPLTVVEATAERAIESEQWDWLARYRAWQAEGETLAAKTPAQARDESGAIVADDPDTQADEAWVNGYTPEQHQAALDAHAAAEPPRPALVPVAEYLAGCAGYVSLAERAKAERERLCEADITVHGVSWQVDGVSRDHLRSAIETAAREGYPVDTTQPWILADNTVFEATAAQLGAVLTAYSLRMGQVFSAYSAWRAGPQDAPFTL